VSLTEQAYRDRKWGRFPLLRHLLEGKRIPDSFFGFSSASDNIFDGVGRLLEIIILVNANRDEILDTAANGAATEKLEEELILLMGDISNALNFFEREQGQVKRLQEEIGRWRNERKDTTTHH
jgi:hypothetical protein